MIRLLQIKTGETPQGPGAPRGGAFALLFDIVAQETGLSTEEIQAALAEGTELTEIIENNGADVETVRAALLEGLSEIDLGDVTPETLAEQWLGPAE